VTSPDEAVPTASAQDATSPKTQQVVDLVTAAGERGLTVHELAARTGWHHGMCSGTLSRLARQGRVRTSSTFRAGATAYRAP
jgi:DNA-binding IclR family transcriptional regulator